jgi:Tfp pilus assembly protein PilN
MRAVNLLPPDLRGAQRRGRRPGSPAPEAPGGSGPFVVLGALAMCVIALAGYVIADNTVEEREAQLAAVTAEHAAAARKAAALKPYGDFQQLAVTRRSGVQALAAMRFNWDRALADISRAVPADVTLSSLSGNVAGPAADASTEPAPPSIELVGCTRSQAGVAELLSRMRTVRGVTKVELTSSQRGDAPAGEVAAGTDQGPCGRIDAPKFTLRVAFERFAGAAAAAPDTAAPAPAATPQAGSATATATPQATATATATPAPGGATATSASTAQGSSR